jgi:hypothetical protein
LRVDSLPFFSAEEVARARRYHRPLCRTAAALALELGVPASLDWSEAGGALDPRSRAGALSVRARGAPKVEAAADEARTPAVALVGDDSRESDATPAALIAFPTLAHADVDKKSQQERLKSPR